MQVVGQTKPFMPTSECPITSHMHTTYLLTITPLSVEIEAPKLHSWKVQGPNTLAHVITQN